MFGSTLPGCTWIEFPPLDVGSGKSGTPWDRMQAEKASAASEELACPDACIRAHGEPNYPDPTFGGGVVNFGNLPGIDTNSPQYQAALHACASLNPENGHGGSR